MPQRLLVSFDTDVNVLLVLYTLNICVIKFSQTSENNILVCFNFEVHDISWLQIVKKNHHAKSTETVRHALLY